MSKHREYTLKELIKINVEDDIELYKIRFGTFIIRMQTRRIMIKNFFLDVQYQLLLAKFGMMIIIRRMKG